jgi:enediyne polyketide synthase
MWEAGGISAAHQEALTFAIAGKGEVACDVETVTERTDSAWVNLLGKERFELASKLPLTETGRLSGSATRLWTSLECLRKAGMPPDAPLVFEAAAEDGWVLLRSGGILIATCVLSVQEMKEPLAFAIAFRPEGESTGVDATNPLRRQGVAKGTQDGGIRITND